MESGCARIHIVSTGNGDDDAFASLYANAKAGRGAYKTCSSPRLPTRGAQPTGIASTSRRRPIPTVPAASTPAVRRMPSAPPRALSSSASASSATSRPSRSCTTGTPGGRSTSATATPPVCGRNARPQGQLCIVDELLPDNTTTPEFAAQIKAREASYGLVAEPLETFCDPAGKGDQYPDRQSLSSTSSPARGSVPRARAPGCVTAA